jgi:hypothetical protein
MNRIVGRVVLRGTNVGIPGVLVTALRTSQSQTDQPRAIRLVSTITDDRGQFDAVYDGDRQPDATTARDLVVVVSAPDDDGSDRDRNGQLAMQRRHGAAASERFVIGIDEAKLTAAGLPVPKGREDVDDLIARRRAAAERHQRLRVESNRLRTERVSKRLEFARLAEPAFAKFLSALSGVPEDLRRAGNTRYVREGGEIAAANRAAIRSGIRGRVNPATATGAIPLSEESAARFRDANGRFHAAIPAHALEPYLRPEHQRGPGLYRQVPPSMLCHDGPVDPCVEILEGKDVPDEAVVPADVSPCPDEAPIVSVPAKTEDIPLYLGNLVSQVSSPESPSIFKVHCRAGVQQVEQSVSGFALKSGPADSPALYDFHSLQIAFEDVWQELFDDGLKKTVKDLYTDLVEVGVDPNAYLVSDFTNPKELIAYFNYLKSLKADNVESELDDPSSLVTRAFEISAAEWAELSADQQGDLELLADEAHLNSVIAADYFSAENTGWMLYKREQLQHWRRQGERLIRYAENKVRGSHEFDQYHQILSDLETSTRELYRFSVYAAHSLNRSINFGLVSTYRQEWKPVAYQVGRLVKTIPLAPKEVRRFTKKVAIRKTRAEKEVENNLQTRRTDVSETARAETEIVQKAMRKTNFQASAEGGVNIGIASAKGSTAFGQDAGVESQEVKKEFREAVFKASEEYKSERNTEINVSTSEDVSFDESGEISNPNDEIPVTYLFYELQRRFRVGTKLHAVRPVVLVAQEFPNPNDIDEAWLIRHDWILRRVILDDSFIPAMNYVTSKVVGDEFALRELSKNVEQQRRITDELKEELVATRSLAEGRYAALQASMTERADALQRDEEGGGITPMPVGFLMSDSDVSPEAQQVREDAARDAYERAVRQARDVQSRLERETAALTALTEAYTKELSDHLNRKTQIARLRVHVKANIMYYMQAIWSFEPPDQRFFRLHQVRVPKLQGQLTYTLEDDPDGTPMPPTWAKPTKLVAKCALPDDLEFETLAEAADLDNLLGFKGNYMMFPLKKSNTLTDFMMVPYLDPILGLRDPDPAGTWTLPEFIEYVCCLRKQLSKDEFVRRLPGLIDAYRQIQNASGAEGDEIVVPTDSLFIEALPGVHPILEDFKLFHRLVDVKKAQAEVRAAELENVRAAARLLAGERDDPSIEKTVVIKGNTNVITDDD